MRFRCLAFLEQQVEELERAEQDRMEERQVTKQEAKKMEKTKTNTNTMAKIRTKGRIGSDGGAPGDKIGVGGKDKDRDNGKYNGKDRMKKESCTNDLLPSLCQATSL